MADTNRRDEIAANVRAEKGRRRVADADIAHVLGISRPAANERLNGKTHFRIEELEQLAEYFQVPLDVLLAPAQRTEVAS